MRTPGEDVNLHSSSVQVVIPFRGSLDFLKEAAESVRNSIGVKATLLVVDNRTGNPEKPEFLDTNEYVFAGEIGLSGALQFSKNFLTESYVAILAADDLVHPRRFAAQLSLLLASNADISLCRMLKFGENRKNIPSLSGEIKGDIFLSEYLLLGPYGADGTVLMTKDFFVNRFFLDPQDAFADWTLALEEYPQATTVIVDEKLYLYRQHRNQVTRNYQNPWERSGVLNKWLGLCMKLGLPTVNAETMQIVCAPWYRVDPSKDNLVKAVQLLGRIYRNVCDKTTDREAIGSIERVILRRLIFRVRPKTLLAIFKELKALGIVDVRSKFLSESFHVFLDILKQFRFHPRLIFPESP